MREIKFAENLERIKKERKLTDKAIGYSADIAQCSIHSYRTGKQLPNIYTICRLADGLGVTLDELVYGENK